MGCLYRRAKKGWAKAMNRIGILTGMIFLSFLLVLTGCSGKEKQYNDAVNMMQKGKYEEAAAAFKKLGEYSDSKEKMFECENYIDIESAKQKMEEGDYVSAQNILRNLTDVPDAEDLFRECSNYITYNNALAQMEAGDTDSAMAAFLSLGDFEDSQSKAEECGLLKKYNEALALLERKDYASARAAFVSLGTFRDSTEQVQKIDALSEDELWKAALITNTYEAYAPFLENPQGRYYVTALDKCEQLLWNSAVQQNTAEAYQKYLNALPNGKYTAQARSALQGINGEDDYLAAVAKDTILALQEYITAYPNSSYTAEANNKITQMKKDSKYYNAFLEDMSEESATRFLSDYPGHKNEGDVRKLLERFTGDIKTLINNGSIKATATGASMQRCTLTITNLTRFKVTVKLNYGTYFIAKDASKDNMLMTKEYTLTIAPEGTYTQEIQTCSMNISRQKPSASDVFEIGILSATNKLVKLLPKLVSSSYPVIQSAVWIVTDNADDTQLLNSIYYADNTPVIKQGDINTARKIVDKVK